MPLYRVMVLCICYYRCRRREQDPGRHVALGLRNRHRKRDALTFETKAYDGLYPPALLVDAHQYNHHKSFRVPLPQAPIPNTGQVGSSRPASVQGELGDAGDASGSGSDHDSCYDAAGGALELDSVMAPESSPGDGHVYGIGTSTSQAGSPPPQTSTSQVGCLPPPNPSGSEVGISDGGFGVDDGPAPLDPLVTALASEFAVSFMELNGDADLAGERPVEIAPVVMPLDADLEEEIGMLDPAEYDLAGTGGDAALDAGEEFIGERSPLLATSGVPTVDTIADDTVSVDIDTYGVVAAMYTYRMGPLTLLDTLRLERLRERIQLEEAAAIRLAPTLSPLGAEFLHALLPPFNTYEYVPDPGSPPPPSLESSSSNLATLDLLAAWRKTGGTVENYVAFSAVLARHAKTEIKTLYLAGRLVEETSGLVPIEVDMCPASCVAFTGPREDMTHCPMCGLARYRDASSRRKRTAVKTYSYVPYLPRLRAYFGSKSWSQAMRYWGQHARSAERAFTFEGETVTSCKGDHLFGDLCDGMSVVRHRQHGHFVNDRDVAVAISTDGAQLLPNRRNSSAWLVIVQTLNLPPSLRFAVDHQHVSLVVPGPGAPKDLDSFLWPLYSELASLERGTMVWDSVVPDWFLLRVHLLGVFADQPASAKVSHFVGGCGLYGCRFCIIRAVRNETLGHSAYFPLSSRLSSNPLNGGRQSYDPSNLPLRTVAQYRLAVARLATSEAVVRRKAVGTSTGIARLPPISFSSSFHPFEHFPLDPFHLFNFNVPRTIWKALIGPMPGEYGLTEDQRTQFGAFIASNAKAYPTSFSSRAPRDISLYSNTGYKMVEWGSVFHHFLPAFLHFVGASPDVRTMLDEFLLGVDLSMEREGVTLSQIGDIGRHFTRFVTEWERLYVGSDAAIARATISIHLLLHVADQLATLGSVRATSQATCERMIGLLKQGVTAFRSPYAVMANRALSRAQVTLSRIRLGHDVPDTLNANAIPILSFPIHPGHEPLSPQTAETERALMQALDRNTEGGITSARSYGRMVFGGGTVIRGSRIAISDSRSCDKVEVFLDGSTAYCHVLHFNLIEFRSSRRALALVRRFAPRETCPKFMVGSWCPSVELIPISSIVGIVAALTLGSSIYVVRRSTWQQDPIFGSGFEADEQAPCEFNVRRWASSPFTYILSDHH
ncbi:hypothetical protein CF319_g4216 [Tilletia indica]|nr:hypothetical protein CF319_g4216 [Tilletia indica]